MSSHNYSARWIQAERNNNYMEWLALSSLYASLAREAMADKSATIAASHWKQADEAHKRALALEPKDEAA